MIIKLNKKVGDATVQFEIDEKNDDAAFTMMAFLSEPDHCWLQGFTDSPVTWQVRKAKGDRGDFTYVERKARNPLNGKFATSTMGKYKDGGYFWKKWEVYEGGNKEVATPEIEGEFPY